MPNVVIYTFNDTKDWDSDFNIYKPHSGISLETQFLPNDINLYGNKANSILKANEHFILKQLIIYQKNKVNIKAGRSSVRFIRFILCLIEFSSLHYHITFVI